MTLSEFIKSDKNMTQAMKILVADEFWIAHNCKQVAMYLDSKGYDGLAFVKACGKKYAFMDNTMLKMSDMVASVGGSAIDDFEIEMDKVLNNVHEYV
jgi:hypothetical protein